MSGAAKEDRVKILVVGPSQTGKSQIANFLSGLREQPMESYKETAPLRILETVLEGLNTAGTGKRVGKGTRATIELWDVGGSSQFRNCWPAIKNNADGIIFVMNCDVAGQERVLDFWSREFLDTKQTPINHCVIFAHHSAAESADAASAATAGKDSSSSSNNNSPPRLPPLPRSLQTCRGLLETSFESHKEVMKDAFSKLVEQVLVTRRKKEEEEAYQSEMNVRVGANQ